MTDTVDWCGCFSDENGVVQIDLVFVLCHTYTVRHPSFLPTASHDYAYALFARLEQTPSALKHMYPTLEGIHVSGPHATHPPSSSAVVGVHCFPLPRSQPKPVTSKCLKHPA
ncbi:hypothetical protein J3459_015913 [Metarhizium acridum]|nr:hypothetical protein J3459_015913 [Metarhizium acridum]